MKLQIFDYFYFNLCFGEFNESSDFKNNQENIIIPVYKYLLKTKRNLNENKSISRTAILLYTDGIKMWESVEKSQNEVRLYVYQRLL